MSNTPIDQPQRNRALDTQTSFAVSAPAGSGKTGLLTQRVLALLALCEEPENILAITFTRKAAAEMQHRILGALRDAENTPEEPAEDFKKTTWQLAHNVLKRDQEKGWQLFNCPNRLRITTIDSLCRSISQQMPFESQLGDTPEILDNPNTAYQLAARETLALLDRDEDLNPHLTRLIQHFDNRLDFIEDLFTRLLAKRDQWLSIVFQTKDQRQLLELMLSEVIDEHLRETQNQLLPIASEVAILADHAANNLRNTDSPIEHCLGINSLPQASYQQIKPWLGICELLLTQKGEWRKSATKAIGFAAPSDKTLSPENKESAKLFKQRFSDCLAICQQQPELAQWLHQIRSLPDACYQDVQWQLLDSLNHILLRLASQLTIVFQQLGKSDYLAITLAALDALGDTENPTDLALALDYKIQHILVDEFQDTSTTQLQLLQQLTAGWQSDDGRTLFVVGDAMQSCYRFRDANVGIFLEIRERGIGDIQLEALDLQVNFRSQQGVVDWVNRSFDSIFPSQSNSQRGAVSYNPSVAFNAALDISPVCAHLLAYSDTLPPQRLDEAETIRNIIQQTRDSRPDDTIALLIRSKAQAQTIIPVLQQAGITIQATDIDRLDRCMPVLDLLSLTRALLYPHDRMAWLAVLRAPWCGLGMDDLLALCQPAAIDSGDRGSQPLLWLLIQSAVTHNNTLSSDGLKKLQRLHGIFDTAFAHQQRHRLRHWIEGIWLALGGPGLLLNPNDSQNINTFFDLLDAHEQGGTIPSWDELETAVTALYAKPQKNLGTAEPFPPVQIMSIHKSKGLEFDTVIIPGLEKRTRGNDQELLVWMERLAWSAATQRQERQLLISPVHATGNDSDPIYQFIQQQHRDKDQLESDRLLYVGCTRAIKQLHLVSYVQVNAQEEVSGALTLEQLKTPASYSLLSRLWDSIAVTHCNLKPLTENAMATQKLATSAHENTNLHPGKIISLNAGWQAPPLTPNTLLANYRGNNELAKVTKTIVTKTKATTTKVAKTKAKPTPTQRKQSQQQDLFSVQDNEPDTLVESTASAENSTPSETRDNIASPDALLQREQRYIGSIIHLALEHITQTDFTQWNATRIEQQQATWKTQLLQIGISPTRLDHALGIVNTAVNRTLNDKTGQWLLDCRHQDSHTELELWDKHGQHIIDRTFIADTIIENETDQSCANTRWIIDYKSSEPDTQQSIEDFINQQKQQYRAQLKRYARLFKDEGLPVKTALYFPVMGLLAEVSC